MTNAQAQQNIPITKAAARVDSAGVFLSNNGGFRLSSAVHLSPGVYELFLAFPVDRLRAHVTVSVEGAGGLVGWEADTTSLDATSPSLIVTLTDSTNAGIDAAFSVSVTRF